MTRAADFAGTQRPFYREWFHDVDGAVGVYWIGDNTTHVAAPADVSIAFRCVKDGL